jgi:hypothetical protein
MCERKIEIGKDTKNTHAFLLLTLSHAALLHPLPTSSQKGEINDGNRAGKGLVGSDNKLFSSPS